jgi:uncharacterized repeat protein (TIGR01451 family)
MRGMMAVVRVLLVLLVIGLVANCGDDPTAPERSVGNQAPTVFATASNGNGLSITTDKDDYAPGDTVWFTGAGWTPGDTLDIVLTDSVDVHNWSVGIDDNGGFRDSTYVVDVNDLGVTFTLTATSRSNSEQTLTVIFTDGNPTVSTITLSPGRPDPGQAFTASFTVSINAGGGVTRWRGTAWRTYPRPGSPSGSYTCINTTDMTTAGTSPTTTLNLTAPAAGDYTLDVQTYSDDNCATNVGNGGKKDFTVGTSDLTITKSHSGNFTAGSTGSYTITVTNSGTGATDGPVTVTDVLPSGFTYNAASGTSWTCSQSPAGTASCTRGGGNTIAASASAPAITLTVNVASDAASSIINTATVAIGGGGAESNTGNNSASDPTTVAPAVAGSKLAFTTAPFTTVVGECSPTVTIQTQNASGGATNPSTNVTVNLTSSSSGGTFYNDAGCTTSITSRQILTTGNTADFYYKDSKAGFPKLTATDAAANLTAADQTETVSQAATTTTISSVSPSPATFGQLVTVNYSVTVNSPGSGTPTGNVTVKDGSTTLCSATVAAGSCQFYPAGAGSLSLVAGYAGDANFASSSSSPATPLTVNRAPTTTAIGTISPSSPFFGQQITVNFTVVPTNTGAGYNYGSVVPTGTVDVKDGTTLLCSGSVATGNCKFYPTGAGTLSLKAYYTGQSPDFDGDANFLASSTASPTSLTVDRAPTTTSITSPDDEANFIVNQQVTVNFTVGPKFTGAGYDYGSVVPTGTVQVKDGSTLLCSGTLSSGSGSCDFTAPSAGHYILKAYYLGDASSYPGDDENADADFLASQSDGVDIYAAYRFLGLSAPVDRPTVMNLSKAGQAIPLKWQLLDYFNNPVTTLASVIVKVKDLQCTNLSNTDQIEEYATGSTGLQNLGGGYYQFNWKTPSSYASSCKNLLLDVGEGKPRDNLAYFTFKK